MGKPISQLNGREVEKRVEDVAAIVPQDPGTSVGCTYLARNGVATWYFGTCPNEKLRRQRWRMIAVLVRTSHRCFARSS